MLATIPTGKGPALLVPTPSSFIIRLVNKRAVMGRYTNGQIYNAMAWTTVVAVAGLSVFMVLTTILPPPLARLI